MRLVIQRVKKSSVKINDEIVGSINNGLLVFLAIHKDDSEDLIAKAVEKILKLRIFSDEQGKMNKSVTDINGDVLVVSQFTLYADTKKGTRPGFTESARPEKAIPFYEKFVSLVREKGIKVETGKFGAEMKVEIVNDGPVTLIMDI